MVNILYKILPLKVRIYLDQGGERWSRALSVQIPKQYWAETYSRRVD